MGLNGFIIDRKPQIYQSQPALVYSSTPPPPPNGYMNGHSPKDEQYSVVLRPKKVRFWFFLTISWSRKHFEDFSMRANDSSHRKTPYRVILKKISKNFFGKKLLEKLQKCGFFGHPVHF